MPPVVEPGRVGNPWTSVRLPRPLPCPSPSAPRHPAPPAGSHRGIGGAPVRRRLRAPLCGRAGRSAAARHSAEQRITVCSTGRARRHGQRRAPTRLPFASSPLSCARSPACAGTASRCPCARPPTPPDVVSDANSSLPAASTYHRPPRDFHSTPASTRGSRAPQAGESSARAATAPGDTTPPAAGNVDEAWNWARTLLPVPRQVSARCTATARSRCPRAATAGRTARSSPTVRRATGPPSADRRSAPSSPAPPARTRRAAPTATPRSAGPGRVRRGPSAAGSRYRRASRQRARSGSAWQLPGSAGHP